MTEIAFFQSELQLFSVTYKTFSKFYIPHYTIKCSVLLIIDVVEILHGYR